MIETLPEDDGLPFYIRHPGSQDATFGLLLLHGTGGDETQLVGFGQAAAPRAPLISIRGRVWEGDQLRHFRRFPDGALDEDDLARRAGELADIVHRLTARHALPPLVAVGYSNGANLAAASLALHPGLFAGAVLLRAVWPFTTGPRQAHTKLPVLVLDGIDDPIAPPSAAHDLHDGLARLGMEVELRLLQTGHDLTDEDMTMARKWLSGRKISPHSPDVKSGN